MSNLPFRRFTPEHAEEIGRAVEAAMIGHQGYMMRAVETYDEYLERTFEPKVCNCGDPDCEASERPTVLSDVASDIADENLASAKENFVSRPVARASMIRDCHAAAETLKMNSHKAGAFMLIIVGEQGDDLVITNDLKATGASVMSSGMGSLHRLALERVMERVLNDNE